MNLLLVVVEHPAGYIACLHGQDNCLHQVAGSLEDQVVFRQQSLRRQWFTCNKLSLSKNTLITVKTTASIKLRAALRIRLCSDNSHQGVRQETSPLKVISISQVASEDC